MDSLETLGIEEQHTWVSLMSPSYPGQDAGEVSNLEPPPETDKKPPEEACSLYPQDQENSGLMTENLFSNNHPTPIQHQLKPIPFFSFIGIRKWADLPSPAYVSGA